jgi:hypothetical protein
MSKPRRSALTACLGRSAARQRGRLNRMPRARRVPWSCLITLIGAKPRCPALFRRRQCSPMSVRMTDPPGAHVAAWRPDADGRHRGSTGDAGHPSKTREWRPDAHRPEPAPIRRLWSPAGCLPQARGWLPTDNAAIHDCDCNSRDGIPARPRPSFPSRFPRPETPGAPRHFLGAGGGRLQAPARARPCGGRCRGSPLAPLAPNGITVVFRKAGRAGAQSRTRAAIPLIRRPSRADRNRGRARFFGGLPCVPRYCSAGWLASF